MVQVSPTDSFLGVQTSAPRLADPRGAQSRGEEEAMCVRTCSFPS